MSTLKDIQNKLVADLLKIHDSQLFTKEQKESLRIYVRELTETTLDSLPVPATQKAKDILFRNADQIVCGILEDRKSRRAA